GSGMCSQASRYCGSRFRSSKRRASCRAATCPMSCGRNVRGAWSPGDEFNLILSEHAASNVASEPGGQAVFAIGRLLAQVLIKIHVDFRELRAQYDLKQQRYLKGRQPAASFVVGNWAGGTK